MNMIDDTEIEAEFEKSPLPGEKNDDCSDSSLPIVPPFASQLGGTLALGYMAESNRTEWLAHPIPKVQLSAYL